MGILALADYPAAVGDSSEKVLRLGTRHMRSLVGRGETGTLILPCTRSRRTSARPPFLRISRTLSEQSMHLPNRASLAKFVASLISVSNFYRHLPLSASFATIGMGIRISSQVKTRLDRHSSDTVAIYECSPTSIGGERGEASTLLRGGANALSVLSIAFSC